MTNKLSSVDYIIVREKYKLGKSIFTVLDVFMRFIRRSVGQIENLAKDIVVHFVWTEHAGNYTSDDAGVS